MTDSIRSHVSWFDCAAIENYMQLMMVEDTVRTSNETVLKEFISLKPSSDASEENRDPDPVPEKVMIYDKAIGFMISCIQDETYSVYNTYTTQDRVRKPVAVEARKVREDAHSGDKEDDLGSEGEEGKGGDGEDKKKSASQGKTRRWWSEDLHKRFLDALQQLGGCHGETSQHSTLIFFFLNAAKCRAAGCSSEAKAHTGADEGGWAHKR